jgi:hypothetical protein
LDKKKFLERGKWSKNVATATDINKTSDILVHKLVDPIGGAGNPPIFT